MSEPLRVRALLDLAIRVFTDSTHIFEDHDNELEAEELLAHCLDVDVEGLDDDFEPPRRLRERFLALVARRAGGEPFPFLTGYIEFYGLHLEVKPGSFVPRPSSELVVDRAVRRIKKKNGPVVVDVCAGAAPIALAVADEIPSAEVWAVDIDKDGLAQGRRNAKLLDIENVDFADGDMYDPLPGRLKGRVDVITGHVPYILPGELEDLPSEIRDHEPVSTLSDSSEDGLGLMRRAILESLEWLKPGGWLLLEIAEDLGDKLQQLCAEAGLIPKGVASDNDGLSVCSEAQKPSSKGRSR